MPLQSSKKDKDWRLCVYRWIGRCHQKTHTWTCSRKTLSIVGTRQTHWGHPAKELADLITADRVTLALRPAGMYVTDTFRVSFSSEHSRKDVWKNYLIVPWNLESLSKQWLPTSIFSGLLPQQWGYMRASRQHSGRNHLKYSALMTTAMPDRYDVSWEVSPPDNTR